MAAIRLPVFAGMVPAVDKRLIKDENAQNAVNTWLYSGALTGLATPIPLNTVPFLPKTNYAFRIPLNVGDPSYLFDSHWLEFENADTDVISAPTAGDQFERYYWASTSEGPPKYNTKARIINGDPPWVLGIPQPGNLNVVVSGGSSGVLVSRAYITTLVSAYGEEGPGSTPFVVEDAKKDATFTITVAAVDGADLGGTGDIRNIDRIRLYRTIVTAQGTANYYLLHEFVANNVPQDFVDHNIFDKDLADNPILESTNWSAPPQLQGWAVMPNGIVIGFIGKDLWFSEPYRPHAWPAAYSLTLAYEVVGIAVIGQTAVICTKGSPYTASGVNSFAVTSSMLASFEPCISKGSIVPTEKGVYYMSPNGLIVVNSGHAENITEQFITRDKWEEITNGIKANAGRFGATYLSYGGVVDKAFQTGAQGTVDDAFQSESSLPAVVPADPIDMVQTQNSAGSAEGFMIDPTNAAMGFVLLRGDESVKSISNDYYSSELIIVRNTHAYWFDQRPGFTTEPYLWRSKQFQSPELKNFSAMKVFFYEDVRKINTSDDLIVPTGPQDFNVDQEYDPSDKLAVVRVFADNKKVYAAELRTSGELLRLPSGFKAHFWEVEIEGRAKVTNLQMATSVKELQNV